MTSKVTLFHFSVHIGLLVHVLSVDAVLLIYLKNNHKISFYVYFVNIML